MTHELKTWNQYYQEVFIGHKTFEIRKNDRNFKKWDRLLLREWNPKTKEYTGRELKMTITGVYEGFGLKKGYVILGIK